MGDLSKDFSRHEFACKCGCGFDTVDAETLQVLQDLRDWFKKPITINSGCRCSDYNTKIGGSKRSQHMFGRAADISVYGIDPAHIYAYLDKKYEGKYGIGKYNTFTHIDTRTDGPARW